MNKKGENKENKVQYAVKCFRLADETMDNLEKQRIESGGKSWNLFFVELMKRKANKKRNGN